ncbi:calcium-binding protein [Providencia rettgeri]|uniref:calcium-binding protein n=1 Tax=Providencia rettgeri TaxID=587 RepID=UPI00236144A4|nr:calcium-binding protein [Providencia rettgeri]
MIDRHSRNETITFSLKKLKNIEHLHYETRIPFSPSNFYSGSPIHINLMNGRVKLSGVEIDKAKLANINNAIINGGDKSKIFLKGNRKDNYLDAGMTNAVINGYGGSDHLTFRSGVVRGGADDDYYYLRRYKWESANKKPLTKLDARIVETSQGKSVVSLGYTLKEITKVKLVGNDLVITIETVSPYNNINTLELSLTLKNVYQERLEGKALKHHYQLKTKDGFSLKPISKNNSDKSEREKFFEISYFQSEDYVNRDSSNYVKINKEKKYIVINNNGYRFPEWGKFNLDGDMKNLRYTGSEGDDELERVNRNSYIMATQGNDIYHLKPGDLEQSELTVDFSQVEGISTNRSIIIDLPDEYGNDLYAEGQSVYFKNVFNDKKLNIKFVNYEHSEYNHVYIKDANSNIFQVKLSQNGHTIVGSPKIRETTQMADEVYLSPGYSFSDSIIDTLAGDDSIENYSGTGVIVNGGEGNDKIKASKGSNVFYGGDGDDVIEGGNQGDLLLSDLGNDTLKGRGGNDHYIVDGSIGTGTTVISDDDGINNIHLMHFHKNPVIENSVSRYWVYSSISSLRKVKIKISPEIDQNKNHIHHYDRLPHHVPNDVKGNMSHMIRYLAEHQQYWKSENPLIPWQPMFAFKGTFNNTSQGIIDLSKPIVTINQDTGFHQLVMNIKGNPVDLTDNSGYGRFYKVEHGVGKIAISKFSLSHNVLYAGEGNTELSGGRGNDVFIINGNSGKISDEYGNNMFIIDGGRRGWSDIHYGKGDNQVHLISFNKIPVILKQNDKNPITQYIYESESGYKVTISQAEGMPEPTVIHHNLLPGRRDYTTQQKLEYLGNTLAAMRLQDEYNSQGVNSIKPEWNPASLVRAFMDKGTVI